MDSKIKKESILIGWASENVTPSGLVSLCGQFHLRITEEIHDILTVTALALESQNTKEQAIIISLDAGMISDDVLNGVRSKVSKLILNFDERKLFISATHTHTAPDQPNFILGENPGLPNDVVSEKEYADLLIERISVAAIEAWESRKKGALSWGSGHAVIGFNRRVSYFDGSTQMYGNTNDSEFSHIEGHEDHGVNLLFTYDEKHKLTGIIVNVPCPSQCSESEYFISADYWHETREAIQKEYGNNIFILAQCSSAGDLSPRNMINRDADARMLKLKGYGDDYNFARRCDIADKLLAVVKEVMPLVKKEIYSKVEFTHSIVNIELPERKVTADDLKKANKVMQQCKLKLEELKDTDHLSVEYSSTYRLFQFNEKVIKMYKEQEAGKDTISVELHILRIGDIAMCTNRFEYYLDFGDRIKARSKALQTFIVQLTGSGTYLPSARSLKGGSYGAFIASTPIGPEGGQVIVEKTLEQINEIF